MYRVLIYQRHSLGFDDLGLVGVYKDIEHLNEVIEKINDLLAQSKWKGCKFLVMESPELNEDKMPGCWEL
jgi:hypothetical protein